MIAPVQDFSFDCDAIHWRPGELWSLWDIMNRFDAGRLFKAASSMEGLGPHPGPPAPVTIPLLDHHHIVSYVDVVIQEAVKLDLPTSLISARNLRRVLDEATPVTNHPMIGDGMQFSFPSIIRLKNFRDEMKMRVADELATKMVFLISGGKAAYFNSPNLFGDAVFNAFPSANEDIAEAGTCLALERGTACVMHLNRVVEAGLAILAAVLGVPKQNDWGAYLREIDKQLAALIKSSGARTSDEQFYAEAATSIDHMRRAWRNPTMHPEKTYSPERAEEVLQSVRSFIHHLATKIHE